MMIQGITFAAPGFLILNHKLACSQWTKFLKFVYSQICTEKYPRIRDLRIVPMLSDFGNFYLVPISNIHVMPCFDYTHEIETYTYFLFE